MTKIVRKRIPKKKIKCDSGTLPSTNDHGFIGHIFSPADSEVVSNSNFDHRMSIKYGTNVQAVQGIITEYCNDSTVHGFKYIGDRKRPLIERIIWTFALTVSIFTCCYFIKTNWEKRLGGPVIITFDEKQTPVWQIPFPTVTICPETKTNPSIFNYTDVFSRHEELNYELTEDEDSYMKALAQMCTRRYFHVLCPESTITSNISDIIKAMIHLALDNVDFIAKWRDLEIDEKHFRQVLTEEGPCYSFNSFDSKTVYREEALVEGTTFAVNTDQVSEWSLENGFNSPSSKTFPVRTSGFGVKEGLYLSISATPEMSDESCQGTSRGFKLIISTPGEVPQVSDVFISIPFSQKVTVSILPEIVLTSEGIEQYDPDSRHCYFQDERYLSYFKVYTQANCELECISNLTLKQCGCVHYHMPRNASVPVCNHKKNFCIWMKKVEMLHKVFNLSDDVNIYGCNCLPTCKTILYRAELGTSTPLKSEDGGKAESEITISFKEKSFKALRRSERFTFIEFVASCGGLLGLFMGVSILSAVELLSFLTIRLFTNLRMRRKKRLEMRHFTENVNDNLNI